MSNPDKLLIAIDVDGTLLAPDYSLSAKTASFLRALSERGIWIVLSSGRPYRAMKEYYEALDCRGPLICHNGAHVFSPDGSFPEYKKTFPKEEVLLFLKEASPYLCGVQAEGENALFRDGMDGELNPFFPEAGMDIVQGRMEAILQEDPYAVVLREKKRDDDLFSVLARRHPSLLWRHWTGSCFSELALPGVSKGSALSFIKNVLGIPKENCFAFGDSDNDLEMLLEAGHPFAMRNSKSKALLSSFPITEKGNGEDGVAFELSKHFGA